jgi:hypothetical protein
MQTTNTETHARCEVRLSELERSDITNLNEFAECRLAIKGLDPSGGQDATQRAFAAILRGLESDQGGRVPRLVDVETKEAFMNYLRGAISSIVEAMGRKREFRRESEPWMDTLGEIDRNAPNPANLAELSDVRDHLFEQLHARAPRHLKRVLAAWKPIFAESDRIPGAGNRRYATEVKALAREIITELGGIR